jgi:pimeloyl-ACP methyl ester carboxylesterase
MIHWYRAMVHLPEHIPNQQISTPTLILWGDNDQSLLLSMAEDSLKLCDKGKLHYLKGATHWAHHEVPEQVHSHIINFIEA